MPQTSCRVSLCMIVKNGAHTLPASWHSVQGLVSEWILVDTGSSDDTLAVARDLFPDVVMLHHAWHDDFAAARNASLAAATGDWIWVMDADETLDPPGYTRLQALFASPPMAEQAYTVLSQGMTEQGLYFSPILRIFARDSRLSFHGRVHEQAYLSDGTPLRVHSLLEVTFHNAASPGKKSHYYAQLMEQSLAQPDQATPYLRYRYVSWQLENADQTSDLAALAAQLETAVSQTYQLITGTLPNPRPYWFQAPLDLAICTLAQLRVRLAQLDGLPELFERHAPYAHHANYFYTWGLVLLACQNPLAAQEALFRSLDPALLPLEPGQFRSARVPALLFQTARQNGDVLLALILGYQLVLLDPTHLPAVQTLEQALGITQADLLRGLAQDIREAFASQAFAKVIRLAAYALPLQLNPEMLAACRQSYVHLNQSDMALALAGLESLLFGAVDQPDLPDHASAAQAQPVQALNDQQWRLKQIMTPAMLVPRVSLILTSPAAAGAEPVAELYEPGEELANTLKLGALGALSMLPARAEGLELLLPQAEGDWIMLMPALAGLSPDCQMMLLRLLHYAPLFPHAFCGPGPADPWILPNLPGLAVTAGPGFCLPAGPLPVIRLAWLQATPSAASGVGGPQNHTFG